MLQYIDGNSISYIDQSGKTIFNKKFDYKHDYQSNNRGLNEAQRFLIGDYHFNEGLACGRINDKYGCIDYSGKIVVPAQYDYLGRFSEGLVTVMTEEATKNGIYRKWGYLNKNNQMAIPPQFEIANAFSEGLAVVSVPSEVKVKYIDKNGKIIINAPFDQKTDCGSSDFYGGLASGRFDNKNCGFIDKSGSVVISPQYKQAFNFGNGIVFVLSGDQLSKDQAILKQNYIDKNGKTIYTEETKLDIPVRK